MRNSSIEPLKYGSAANCERPIQFWLVLSRRNGANDIAVFEPIAAPFGYSVPTTEKN